MPHFPADQSSLKNQSHQSKQSYAQHQPYSTPTYNRFYCLTETIKTQPRTQSPTQSPTQSQSPTQFQFQRPTQSQPTTVNKKSNDQGTLNKMDQRKTHSKNQTSKKRSISQRKNTINAISKESPECGPKPTILSDILGRKLSVLLDTGSQVNAISQNQLPEEILHKLSPSRYTISSYTGNEVDVMGTFTTDIKIGPILLKNCYFYVSRDNRKTIIGTPALKANKIIIDLAGNNIRQGDHIESLEDQTGIQISISEINLRIFPTRPTPPLQMHSTKRIIIPKRSTTFITISARHPVERTAHFATLDTFDHNMEPGILVGKSLSMLSPDEPYCLLRLCNVNDHDVTINPYHRIINLHAVELMEDSSNTSSVINQLETTSNETKFDQVIKDVKIGTNNKDSISAVRKLIYENLDAFAIDDEPLGQTDKAIYDVNTGNSPPVAQGRYRTPYYLRDEMKKIIDKNVASGLMEPCCSPYAAPVLLVKKQNGTWRLVCDYRKLNDVTISDCYPLPSIDDLVTNLSSSKVFSGADLWTGFHQIPCSEDAKKKLAITTEFGQFTWVSMPMGGKNAPSVFQRLMDNVFQSIPREELVIYLDDLLVHSVTEQQNINQLRIVLQTLIANKLKIRASKTQLLMKEINFCGYILANGSRKPNPKKVEAVKNLKPPTSRTQAQSLFGLLNYHRYFIPNFAKKAAPITTTYKGRFSWTSEAQIALDILKKEISNEALKLKIPDVQNAKFILETDASKEGYGCCLYICVTSGSHIHGSKCLRPVEYASRQFDHAQRNYSTLEKELLAGREALRKWSHFLLGRKFIWRTDNACLQWAHKVRSRILKVSQWLAEISEYDMIIERRPSSTMKISDCLSRNFAELNSLHLTKTDMRDLQSSDEVLERVRHYASINRWPNNPPPAIQPYFNRRSDLVFGTSGELLLQGTMGLRTLPTAFPCFSPF